MSSKSTIMGATNQRIQEITTLVGQLTDQDQEALLKALRRQLLLTQARRLDNAIKPNQVTLEEILSVINQVRQIRISGYAS